MEMDINQTQAGTQDSNASIGVPPAPPPSLNKSQDAASSTLQGNRHKRWTKVELAKALADPNNPYKGPRKRGKSTRGKGQMPQSSLGSQSQSSLRAQTQATCSTNGKSPSATPSNLSGQTQTNQSSPDVLTSTQESSRQFTCSDYKNICFYLEDKENFKQIDLTLTGSQVRQRLDNYKNKYRKAKDFEWNTGAGIKEQECFASLKQKLEAICPCYNQMDGLFKEKANIMAMRCLDSTSGTGISSVGEDELDDGVGNPVPLESQSSEASATQDGSQPWSNWMETQETPCANHTANQADDQASPTAASQFLATDSNLPKEQVQSASQDVQSSKSSQTGVTM
ncbi:hypothetical protein PCANC_09785 [Puccinia coronata f. sp. avenae]|uniref:Uncharacterized protein n=1 Tax=Puccinia coronata f. sp. avenae TaxID=200324 RepID=A0A2N5VT73_9BASI|nr:hypothetical protein PCANC_09785 [Puccinia coronata f. sp. avenae]